MASKEEDDMPQPLSKFDPRASLIMATSMVAGNDFALVFQNNPKLGLLAMEAIAAWSQVELCEYRVFADMSGGPSSETYENYMNLECSQGMRTRT